MPIRLSNREAFALPLSILIIAVLTVAVAAGFAATTAEYATNTAERGENRSYNLAETGLEQFVVLRNQPGWCQHCVTDPTIADSEWTRVSLPGGYANVVAVKVRPVIGTTNALYFIKSTGTDTVAKLGGGGGVRNAQHIVGEYATWNTATINVKAAWVSLSGLVKNGTGTISGIDQCGAAPSLAGIMVPTGGLTIAGGSFTPQGNPPVDTSNTFTQLKPLVKIDWAGIMAGSLAADITIPGQSFPSATAFSNDTTYWPIIRVHTNGFSLPNAGRGIIIADSDFTISGSNMWNGIVLVGGQLTSNGDNTTSGATLSGLNYLIGGTPAAGTVDDSYANGQKTYVYNSCNVANATSRLRRYSVMPNTWSDNLAAW